MKKWIINDNDIIKNELHKNKLVNSLLSSRGIKNESEVEEFLYPNISKLHNPFILKDMDEAVERIDKAIEKRQKIVIYGDYDVDGITSTAILYRAFKKLGVDVNYYIPDRMVEGYGINKDAIDYIKTLQTDLIITVDCGITSISEVEYAKQLGMDIIVTDHHECKDVIPNTIVINPKRKDCVYPNKSLAGCGIAFKIVQALWMKYNLYGYDDFLDIAAIGTIADVVELKGENRIIVKNGLAKINTSVKNGIRALKEVTNIGDNINSFNVAFQIAPRINAVGRLSDAKIAVELFVTNDYDKALQIAKFLDQENKKRQKIEEKILNEAQVKIEETIDLKKDKVIVLNSHKWHHGVVGIVASKLVEQYHRPVILLCDEGQTSKLCKTGQNGKRCNEGQSGKLCNMEQTSRLCSDSDSNSITDSGIDSEVKIRKLCDRARTSKGSGRSIKGFSLFDALCSCSDLLVKFGGHEMAAGLTLATENIDLLKQRLNEYAETLDKEIYLDKLYSEACIDAEEVNMQTAKLLKAFEPFGNGNPSPVLYMENLQVAEAKGIGTNSQHLKLMLEKEGNQYNSIYFNGSKEYFDKNLDQVDIMFNLDINEWNNNQNIQLVLKGIRPNKEYLKEFLITNYYRTLKFMLNDKESNFNFDKIKFMEKNINFLREFIYLNKGYVLVSSYTAVKELEFLLELVDVNINTNSGFDSQLIVCPKVEAIDYQNNDVLIYDFLPGTYEYETVSNKVNGIIYNFFDEKTDKTMDDFMNEITIDKEFAESILNDLNQSELVGSIRELSIKYNRNIYIIYKMVMILKDNSYADILIKNDILKVKLKTKNINCESLINSDNIKVEKILNLKKKFKEYH
jgi:single-stranded-DNA-specific exonuclease